MIRIRQEAIGSLLDELQGPLGLTPARVYLDYGKIGDRLKFD